MKKKKSLIGYITPNFEKYFCFKKVNPFSDEEEIHSMSIVKKKAKRMLTKVRITIEEI